MMKGWVSEGGHAHVGTYYKGCICGSPLSREFDCVDDAIHYAKRNVPDKTHDELIQERLGGEFGQHFRDALCVVEEDEDE